MALSNKLMTLGEKTPGLNQYSIKKFAEALEMIPRTLAENAGLDVCLNLVFDTNLWWGFARH